MYVLVMVVMSMTNGVDAESIAVNSVSGFTSQASCETAKESLRHADDFYENGYSIQDAVCVALEDK